MIDRQLIHNHPIDKDFNCAQAIQLWLASFLFFNKLNVDMFYNIRINRKEFFKVPLKTFLRLHIFKSRKKSNTAQQK